LVRPLIRLPEKNIIFTRINPQVCTSWILEWDKLQPCFDVLCTAVFFNHVTASKKLSFV
jgi:hypothetical protein